jgi:hypothetical protein
MDSPEEHLGRRRFTWAATSVALSPWPGLTTTRSRTRSGSHGHPLPDRYHRVVLRLDPVGDDLESELRYEGNNNDLRGARNDRGLYPESGEAVAMRWRRAASNCRGIFVLRDSLWSQQDHITRQQAFAPLLPPNWITAAALAVANGRKGPSPLVAGIDDDEAWRRAGTPKAMFGLAPASQAWHAVAIRPANAGPAALRTQARHARTVMIALGDAFRRMLSVGSGDVEEAIAWGSDLACASDRLYFTDDLRRRRIIPITVAEPSEKEIDEGKGFLAPEHQREPGAEVAASKTRRILLRRRLADGDVAVERYDISKASQRAMIASLLRTIIPAKDPAPGTGVVWVWINGPLDPDRKLRGQDATPWVELLRRELATEDIQHSRVRFFSKPSVELPNGAGRKAALDEAIGRFDRLDLPLSLNLRTAAFRAAIT